jgi:hypothetical protein
MFISSESVMRVGTREQTFVVQRPSIGDEGAAPNCYPEEGLEKREMH